MINNILKTIPSIIKTAIFTMGLIGAASVQAQVFPPDPADVPDANNGAKVWAQVCVRCHNLREPHEFSDYDWRAILLHMRIRAGLTGGDARDIEAFITASNNPTLPESFTNMSVGEDIGMSGEEIFKSTCSSCHGGNGKGTIPGVPDFTKADGRLTKSDDVLFKHVKHGFQTPGNAMAMPPKGGNSKLSDNDLRSVIKYLHKQFGS